MDRKLYRVEEVARIMQIGRSKVFDLMRSGELASVKIGGSRRVPARAIDSYLDRLMDEAA
ncbi:helix-turn-helix domain-containing protein [Actinokineospora sp. PR83]|uniref:helix-turn-helix domain-containing protein n=1 Tax=Actinokineospora sp. PR83 TaxID=2884908 RepID=UPI001F275C72|nr:helix-turn-helix domain-containing protein [Actinokineospora sp. PR83]MCG8914831.1 helix-turn-helix domain-containing protein [Actinokineospora sp. PR83]